jgi:hypothetical protein
MALLERYALREISYGEGLRVAVISCRGNRESRTLKLAVPYGYANFREFIL